MITTVFIIFTAIFKSIQDALSQKKLVIKSAWWNENSWKMKWKGGDIEKGEAFLGSSTVLVWVTDAWHFFGMLRNVSMILAIVLYVPVWSWWLDGLVMWVLHNVVFEACYRWVWPAVSRGFERV